MSSKNKEINNLFFLKGKQQKNKKKAYWCRMVYTATPTRKRKEKAARYWTDRDKKLKTNANEIKRQIWMRADLARGSL